MKIAILLGILLGIFCLPGCGPKEIGEGSASEQPADIHADNAEVMRWPMTGSSNTQQMLYHYNRPAVMQQMQDWRTSQYKKRMGIKPSPEDPAYRAVPKQRSPFRQ